MIKRFYRWFVAPRKRIQELRQDIANLSRYNLGLAMESHRLQQEVRELKKVIEIASLDR